MNCLDSSFLVDFADSEREHHDDAVAWMQARQHEPMFVPTFVIYEFLRGIARAHGPMAVEEGATDVAWLEPIPMTKTGAVEAARIDGELHSTGEQVSAGDRLIAGVVRAAGGTVVTRDRDFERIRDLAIEFYV